MKLSGVRFTNGPTCEGVTFTAVDVSHDIAEIKISGRYPEVGWAINEEVQELVYVTEGSGQLLTKDEVVTELERGDAVYVPARTKFVWVGRMTIVMSCSPPFHPAQYKVEDV